MLNFDSDVDANVNANVKCEHSFMLLYGLTSYFTITYNQNTKLLLKVYFLTKQVKKKLYKQNISSAGW